MLPASDMLPLQDEAVTIEPQYDGVIMLSPEAVLFSDAKPRPDGSKVYHVFERTLGDPPRDEATQSEDFQSRREQLFSQAHENTLHDIQQVLAESGLVNQEWCEASGVGEAADSTSVPTTNAASAYQISDPNFQTPAGQTLTNSNHRTCLTRHQRLTPCRLHQFEMVFPNEQKRRLLKRLRRKGMGYVEFEPENHRINIKTRKSVNTSLSVLRGVDPNARHLGTCRDTLIEETVEPDSSEIMDGL
ncbi:hypothetical protein Hamer_G007544 [Homarus americanus]|uniref:Uncharacterized protein n=1 Tax=Homarus americanus TaxID=6706 RepID=A0A8J5JVK6_HOMAM|nr:hypothetical protein Hamer_G007544 [Homarus americanus]